MVAVDFALDKIELSFVREVLFVGKLHVTVDAQFPQAARCRLLGLIALPHVPQQRSLIDIKVDVHRLLFDDLRQQRARRDPPVSSVPLVTRARSIRPLMGALTTVYFRSTAVRFASAFAATKRGLGFADGATYSSYSSRVIAPLGTSVFATGQIGLGHLQLGLPDGDLGQRLIVDGFVLVRLDREQRLAFLDKVAVLETRSVLRYPNTRAWISTASDASVRPVYSSKSVVSC